MVGKDMGDGGDGQWGELWPLGTGEGDMMMEERRLCRAACGVIAQWKVEGEEFFSSK